MGQYQVQIYWERKQGSFEDGRYSREHTWHFDGASVKASASPQIVALPFSTAEAVDPEEAFVAALSSCHMLWFLHVAARHGYCVDAYQDEAYGRLEKNQENKLAMTEIVLRPKATFAGERQPGEAALAELHEEAHKKCFLANSVTSQIRIQAQ